MFGASSVTRRGGGTLVVFFVRVGFSGLFVCVEFIGIRLGVVDGSRGEGLGGCVDFFVCALFGGGVVFCTLRCFWSIWIILWSC